VHGAEGAGQRACQQCSQVPQAAAAEPIHVRDQLHLIELGRDS
jgi:hypothetical protein